jgi:hypothetical protein
MSASRDAATLPDELWSRVIALCDWAELASLAQCSRQLRRLSDAPELWRRLCVAHGFGNGAAPRKHGPAGGWKVVFRDGCGAHHNDCRTRLR